MRTRVPSSSLTSSLGGEGAVRLWMEKLKPLPPPPLLPPLPRPAPSLPSDIIWLHVTQGNFQLGGWEAVKRGTCGRAFEVRRGGCIRSGLGGEKGSPAEQVAQGTAPGKACEQEPVCIRRSQGQRGQVGPGRDRRGWKEARETRGWWAGKERRPAPAAAAPSPRR